MHIEYKLTFDDYQEMVDAHKAWHAKASQNTVPTKIIGAMLFSMFILAMIGFLPPFSTWLEAVTGSSRRYGVDFIVPPLCLILFVAAASKPFSHPRNTKGFSQFGRAAIALALYGLAITLGLVLLRTTRVQAPADTPTPWNALLLSLLIPHAGWIALMVYVFWFSRTSGKRQAQQIWNGQPEFHRHQSLDVTDDALRIADPVREVNLRWFALTRFTEMKNVFLLHPGDYTAYIIPKRAFADRAQLDHFRDLLTANVTNRPTAFPVLPIEE